MTFRDTGKRDSGNTISRDAAYLGANDGLLIPACAAGKSIVVYDVLASSGSGKLGTAADGEGTRLGFIKAGHNSYGISLIVPAGQGVYTDAQSGNITITYAIVDGIPVDIITNNAREGGTTTTTTTAAPTNLEFALGASSVAEGNAGTSTHTVTVNRIGNASGTATAAYQTANLTATSGVDYAVASGTLTFAAGVTSQTISITITGDTGNEDNETFNITLSSPTQTVGTASITGTNPHVVTITNDDTSTIGFAAATSSVAEGDSGTSTHTVAVNRSDTHGTASVAYATVDGTAEAGTDYSSTTGTLSFADGVGSMDISIVITGDGTVESDEAFTVTLTNASSEFGAATLGTSIHTVTITNDDTAATTTTTTTTTTTATPGAYFRVEDCQASGVFYIISDSMSFMPAVGDVVFWSHTNMNMYCSTVTATGVGGTSVGDIMTGSDFNANPYTCASCISENGL